MQTETSDQFENFRVFVGSIPGQYQKQDLFTLFKGIVRITKIVLPKKLEDASSNKGYCYLYLESQNDYQKLLSLGSIDIGDGRHVVCKPYKKGGQLKQANLENNLRRIILKELPVGTTEKEIYRACSEFGVVEYAFIYKEDQLNESDWIDGQKPRKRNTASVFFRSSESSQAILLAGYILLKSKQVRVEPFLMKFKKDLGRRMAVAKDRDGYDPFLKAEHSLQAQKSLEGPPMPSKYGTALYCLPLNRRYFQLIGPKIESNHQAQNVRFRRALH